MRHLAQTLIAAGGLMSAGRSQVCPHALQVTLIASEAAQTGWHSCSCSSLQQYAQASTASANAAEEPPTREAAKSSASHFTIRSRTLTRSGYREYAPGTVAPALHKPVGQMQGLKVPLESDPPTASHKRPASNQQSDSAEDEESQEGVETGSSHAPSAINWEAHRVLAKLVGGLTKDGKKATAQAIVRDALAIMQKRLAAGNTEAK